MAPKYREVPGLIRKYFVISQDGVSAGGVYLWKSQHDAERLYTADWKKSIQERFGSAPVVTYFESPVVVDNVAGSIQTDA
jgi:putative monooxygenase ydhR